jgi:hypothetical protein
MGRTLAAIVVLAALGIVSGSALAAQSGTGMHAGDVLKYDLTFELQLHVAPAAHTTQAPIAMESSVVGTETITGVRADPDGTVHASVDVVLHSNTAGQTQDLRRTMLVSIAPDGTIQPERGADASMMQYLKAIDDASKMYRDHTLHVGDSFSQTLSVPGAVPVTLTTLAKVVAQKTYRGYPTFAIQTTGNGKIDTQIEGMRATGTVDVAGTSYVDSKDRLVIGQAVRSNVEAMLAGAQGNRVTAVWTANVVLDSFTHHAVAPQKPAATPSAAPSPTPAQTPAPTPTPADQYYTPTPPAPTPSPVVQPYPPLSP